MKKPLRLFVKWFAFRYGKLRGLYVRLYRPTSLEYAEYLKKWGGFHAMGTDCSINVGINITDPFYLRLGNNISLSACTLLGHDGIVRILNNFYGKRLDSVGKIDIRDNSFVGHGAIVMPNVVIGPNSVVAAGSVVTKDVPPGTVVGGVPAKYICSFEDMASRIDERTKSYPWYEMIQKRDGAFDAAMEPELRRMRIGYFYPG